MTLNKPRARVDDSRTRLLAAAMAIKANCRHGKSCKECPFFSENSECALACELPKDWKFDVEI